MFYDILSSEGEEAALDQNINFQTDLLSSSLPFSQESSAIITKNKRNWRGKKRKQKNIAQNVAFIYTYTKQEWF